ncbi:MAG: NAD(P)/FAD-dependent oxidoreductase, partial [Hyphomicrobiaceae bacterium]|nr:NAD(P)/FAD-dependent oxidoreductase [Hyphomicrobiaceae bacterium]
PSRGCPSPQPSPRERGEGVRARVIIGADGPRSAVGWATGRSNRELAETRQITVPLLRPSESTDIFLSAGIPGGYAWLFPKGDVANLGLGVAPAARHRLKPLLESLHRRLVAEDRVGSEVLGHTGGAIPVGGMLDAASRLGGTTVLLTGDAAGLSNPVTGAGINAAVISGTLAGEAAARICRGSAAAAADYAEELADQFGASLDRALARRRELMKCFAMGTPSTADLERSWIAFPAYWAA